MTVATDPLLALPVPNLRVLRESRHLTLVRTEPDFVQGALALTYPMPSGLDAVPSAAKEAAGLRSSPPAQLIPSPEPWAARYLQAVLEALAHQRPVSQLARWTSPDVFRDLTRRCRRQTDAGPGCRPVRQAIATVKVSCVGGDAAEIAARIAEGERSRAIAARLDFRRGRWTCTALTLG
jgi:Family of unknown function (DUF6459)